MDRFKIDKMVFTDFFLQSFPWRKKKNEPTQAVLKALPAGMRVSRNAEQAPRMFGWLKTWDSISMSGDATGGPFQAAKPYLIPLFVSSGNRC